MSETEWDKAYEEALSLKEEFFNQERPLAARLSALATEELQENKIILDKNAISALTKEVLIAPIEALWGEWKKRHSAFLHSFQQCQECLTTLHEAEEEIKQEKQLRIEKLAQIEEEFKTSETYLQVEENKRNAIATYTNLNKKYHRPPRIFAFQRLYWILIGALGILNIFINMQFRASFENGLILSIFLPLITSFFLCFSFHILGRMMKQYKSIFVKSLTLQQKIENYSFLIGGIVSFILGLMCVGSLGEQVPSSDGEGSVLLQSTLWMSVVNVIFWGVGLVIVYSSYDADPLYMVSLQKRYFWENKSQALKENYTKKRKKLVDQSAQEERLKIKKYESLKQKYAKELALWEGIEAHEKWIKNHLSQRLGEELEEYRQILINRVQLLNPLPYISLDGQEISLEEYKSFLFDAEKSLNLS